MAYLLDANVFIAAKNLHYGLDFCPAFWDWLISQNQAGTLFSIEKVGDEVLAVDDELSEWARERRDNFFLTPSGAVLTAMADVTAWVTQQEYDAAAVSTFLQVADYYLVAHAFAEKHVVVTHEVPAASIRKVKIPNVCVGLNIKVMTPYEMLRVEKARFVLGESS